MQKEDPRWIVNDLGNEGKNVNNWHWEEKEITDWGCEYLKSLFKNLLLYKDEVFSISITELRNFSGEIILYNRKK